MIRLARAAPAATRTAHRRTMLPAPPLRAPAERHQRLLGNEAMGLLARSAGIEAALGGPSTPLPAPLRAEMEARFGADFSGVRVHAGPDAAASAEALAATAFTVGRDIVFGAGRFAPETTAGRELLAHELAHVVQQSRGGPEPEGDARLSLEQDAARAAAAPADGGPVAVEGASGVGVQRQAGSFQLPRPGLLDPASAEERFKRRLQERLAQQISRDLAPSGVPYPVAGEPARSPGISLRPDWLGPPGQTAASEPAAAQQPSWTSRSLTLALAGEFYQGLSGEGLSASYRLNRPLLSPLGHFIGDLSATGQLTDYLWRTSPELYDKAKPLPSLSINAYVAGDFGLRFGDLSAALEARLGGTLSHTPEELPNFPSASTSLYPFVGLGGYIRYGKHASLSLMFPWAFGQGWRPATVQLGWAF